MKKVTLKLNPFEAKVLAMQLSAVTDAGAEVLDEEELMALEQIIFKLNEELFPR